MSQPIRGLDGNFVVPIGPKKKHKLGKELSDLASYQVSLNSVKQLKRRSRKWLSQSEAWAAILFFRSVMKNASLVENGEIFLSVNSIQWFQRKRRILSAKQRSTRLSCWSATPPPPLNWKMPKPIRGYDGHLVFPIGKKNLNFQDGVEILLSLKFNWIPFSGVRKELENVSANQRLARPLWFSG